ncbi:PLAC8 family-domain-containing protein [Panaeolus papilionaceus]|nr:PLAC8 family-domain-containing protein [Panaeolus papilionaceus]
MASEKPLPQQPVAEQPAPTTEMSIPDVRRGHRNVLNLPYDADGKRDWGVSLFGCLSDISTTCLACWCPCLAHAKNRRRLDYLNRHGAPDPQRHRILGSEEGVAYLFLDCMCNMGFILQVATRRNIRERYNIAGSNFSDFMVPFCCQQCDIVQGSRELELEEEAFRGDEHGDITIQTNPAQETSATVETPAVEEKVVANASPAETAAPAKSWFGWR